MAYLCAPEHKGTFGAGIFRGLDILCPLGVSDVSDERNAAGILAQGKARILV